jgi:trans-2,3-dihydro-3-hydroxyanthranilate isomerase
MTIDYRFVIADVFSRTPFGGNQLAVIPDARGLSDQQMQQIATEFGFSETTFVLPPADPRHSRRVRIFTPTNELAFAGHPTIGTASVLAAEMYAGTPARQTTLVLEEGIGPISVEIDGAYSRLTSSTPFEAPPHRPSPKAVAAALSLVADDIVDSWYGGIGLRFCYVQLTGTDAVDRVSIDKAEWSVSIAGGWSPHLYVFAGDLRDNGHVHARGFAPALGVEEDPATGSAAGGLVAGLAQRSIAAESDFQLRIDQGIRMGRPSRIDAGARVRDGSLVDVTVGGYTTVVATGTITSTAS